ncbi:MAG: hypothetical protein AAF602_17385 [Myxococcota bacterium]
MARTEEEALEELLNADQSISWSRITAWVASVVTFVVVVALMIVTMRQIAQTDRDAFDAHLREARVQQALDAAREVQVISAEQFRAIGMASRSSDDASLQSLYDDFVHGRFIPFDSLRRLRRVVTSETATNEDRLVASLILEMNSLERWIAPLAESTSDLQADQHYLAIERQLPDGESSKELALLRRRLDSIAVAVGGANEGSCERCANLLWGDDLESLDPEASPSFIDPADSFALAVWQAECLRKLPILVDPAFATCSGEHTDEEHAASQKRGRGVAEERFQVATEAFQAASADGEAFICDVMAGDINEAQGNRTVATHAARAYNGLAMSIINHESVSAERLADARVAIERAICFREEAQETRSQVAASRENLAVIAYREAWQAHSAGNQGTAQDAFNRARCFAEVAVGDNANLPWSWTILYLTNTARSSIFEEAPNCAAALGMAEGEVTRQSRSRSSLWRRLSFFEYDAFAPEELPGLLPMFPAGPFNRTGYDSLELMLLELREDHRMLRDGTEAPWQVFVTSVVEPGGLQLPFGN